MPYISRARRNMMECMKPCVVPNSPGDLNYVITQIILAYLYENVSYQTINDVVGALECVKQEFYRRLVVPYEESKIKENGDVY